LPPDRNFIIDRLPEHPGVIVANGAAHAFKFSSLIGRICSELALDGTTGSNISGFEIDRPILLEANPVRNFMC
jgi:sarcosine oxidase